MKGDKNMLYFYCCEVTTKEVMIRFDGSTEVTNRLQTSTECESVKKELRPKIISELKKRYPNISFDNANLIFIAFNAL